ncbi:MAG: helix-turn-helix domain-containing protein, partial [Saprospiraceae bacterium]
KISHAKEEPTNFQVGHFDFDYGNLKLTSETDKLKSLTQREADLLKLFISNKDEVLKRAFILEALWGENDYFMGRSLDVFISRLRKYLKSDTSLKIENIHGVGFRLKTK